MANCLCCGARTGWNLTVKNHNGEVIGEVCRHCCFCDRCGKPAPHYELVDVPHYRGPEGDRDDDLHLWCEKCREDL